MPACCGKSAEGLKLAHAKKVVEKKAALMVSSEMHGCCSKAVGSGAGCCGKDAKALKADYDGKVAMKAKALVMAY